MNSTKNGNGIEEKAVLAQLKNMAAQAELSDDDLRLICSGAGFPGLKGNPGSRGGGSRIFASRGVSGGRRRSLA
jgi:hypothetical protein